MSRTISDMAAMIRPHSWSRSFGRVARTTESLTYPRNNKSHDIRSGDLGGQRSSAWSAAAVWAEMDYQLDVRLVIKGGKMQRLWGTKKLGKFLFSSVGRTSQSFPPFKCTEFTKCVRELWITLYCQNVHKSPNIPTYTVKVERLIAYNRSRFIGRIFSQ